MTPHRTDSKQTQGDWIKISNLQIFEVCGPAQPLATTEPESETLNFSSGYTTFGVSSSQFGT